MFFDVTDIEAPPLMTSDGLEWVRFRLVRLPRFRLDGIEEVGLGSLQKSIIHKAAL